MAKKPNYKFEKRQRDLAKKKKKEAKLQRKLEKKTMSDEDQNGDGDNDLDAELVPGLDATGTDSATATDGDVSLEKGEASDDGP